MATAMSASSMNSSFSTRVRMAWKTMGSRWSSAMTSTAESLYVSTLRNFMTCATSFRS